MFHSLFKSMFHVRMQEENPDATGAGGAGGADVPAGSEAPDTTTTTTDNSEGGEAGKESDLPSSTEEPGGTEGESTFFYGDSEVTIDIPEDLSAELSAKGLDAQSLAAELYREGGEFTLTPETREKVDAAYGKFAVDAYLAGLKAQNDGFLRDQKDQVAQREQADTERFSAVAELVGGEEGWNSLVEWGDANLPQEEIDELNAVMQSGNLALQKYAIKSLANQRRAAEGDPEAVLIQGDAGAPSQGAALSAQAYREAEQEARQQFRGDQRGYREAVAKLDARRRAGMQKGL